jgi:protoheme IX farnesyltransferase
VTFSALAASVVFTHYLSPAQIAALAGVFLLASGASALNQYQERDLDARMQRTRTRPVPAGDISPAGAASISLILLLAGLVMLGLFAGWTCFFLGLFNVAWYNGFYTWLKKKTAFAVIPGALTGAVPVLMGWTLAGGRLTDPAAIFLAFFLFIWQVPHFWLLMLQYGEEYRNAGLPSITGVFSMSQIRTITFSWLVAASIASLFLLRFRIFTGTLSAFVIVFLSVTLILFAVNRFFIARTDRFRPLFIAVNLYLLLVLAWLVAERVIIGTW